MNGHIPSKEENQNGNNVNQNYSNPTQQQTISRPPLYGKCYL